jgi:hypothetical protein
VKCTPHKFWLIERYGINSALQKRSMCESPGSVIFPRCLRSYANNQQHEGYKKLRFFGERRKKRCVLDGSVERKGYLPVGVCFGA